MIPIRDVIPSRTRPVVTVGLIVANLLVYLWEMSLPAREAQAFVFTFGLVPAHFAAVNLLTSLFVHAGLAHVAGNMLFLWIFGDNVEDRLGHDRFFGFYLVCGVVAALAQVAWNRSAQAPMVGASGAIAGVMGAYLVLYPKSRVLMLLPFPFLLFEVPAAAFLALWFVVQFVSGLGSIATLGAPNVTGGIAFWAHVMGFLCGLALVRAVRRPERDSVDWWGS